MTPERLQVVRDKLFGALADRPAYLRPLLEEVFAQLAENQTLRKDDLLHARASIKQACLLAAEVTRLDDPNWDPAHQRGFRAGVKAVIDTIEGLDLDFDEKAPR